MLAPGQSGSLSPHRNATDQLRIFDALTPRGRSVAARDLRRYFKPAWFGLRGTRAVRTTSPRRGVKIVRDTWGVPHVEGRTASDVAFGAGWATAEDRGVVLLLLKGPGRLAAIDAPNINPLATVGRPYTTSAQVEAFLTGQTALLTQTRKGRETLDEIDAYTAGINAYFRSTGVRDPVWSRNDTYAATALIASQFGRGGGDETRRSMFLSALQTRLGAERGRAVFDDLRQHIDADSSVSSQTYGALNAQSATGGVVVDDGSFSPSGGAAAAAPRLSMSNALLVSAKRSATRHPLFVAGPQVGFSYPAFFTELDLHGGGIDARGISFPGTFGVVIGRGKDFVWSAQSSHSDVIDHYVETRCGDDTHYMHKGACRAMETFDGGRLDGRPVTFRKTVHGPLLGYATVSGIRVAITSRRSSSGREILSTFAFQDLNRNRVRSAKDFLRVMNQVDFSFNWVYADNRDIAFFSSGRLPTRPGTTNWALPTDGTGAYEWTGFAPFGGHARGINPSWGYIAGWNNRPGPRYPAADDAWNWGSVHRVDLLRTQLAARKKHTLATVVGAMNVAATQDLRVVRVWPTIAAVLSSGAAPSPRASELAQLLHTWRAAGGNRLDRDLDGKIDAVGAAIMDAAWPRFADAVLRPVLGPLTERLAQLQNRDDAANSQGSAYDNGWYSYVDKDLRALLGRPTAVKQPYRVRYCGNGDLAACRASLWDALEAAGAALAAAQGPDPSRWRADATPERIRFSGGIMPNTMRFANRPTFQQVMTFERRRPVIRPRR